jgi:uncharacterized protein (TIGR02145 family)
MKKFFFLLTCITIVLYSCTTDNTNTTTVVPIAPSGLTATVVSTTQVNLSWTDNSTNESGYKIQRKTTGGNFADVGSTGVDIATFIDQGLTSNTSYTYRVYAFNAAGNSLQYSNEVSVTTNSSSSNICEVTIGRQIWSCKNMNVSTYRNGDPIPQVTDPTQWATLTTGAWCHYNNDPAIGAIYGKLYNWYALIDPRGLAPQGWHVASASDWNKLVKYIDNGADTTCQSCNQSSTAGGMLKETGLTHWQSPNTGSTNSYSFSALPSGFRATETQPINCVYLNIQTEASWWVLHSNISTSTSARFLHYDRSELFSDTGGNKINGHSVRIVKD